MNVKGCRGLLTAALLASVASVALLPVPAGAATADQLQKRIEALEQKYGNMGQELLQLKRELLESQQKVESATKKAAAAQKKANQAERRASQATKEATVQDNRSIKWHFAGAAKADYTHTNKGTPNDVFEAEFSPIFLVSYEDLLLLEAELETSTRSDGSTKAELEFANLNLTATDWLTVVAGKFLSPVGDFQQHIHPAWINKLPDRPTGFGDDSAIPLSDIGVMARGAFPLAEGMSADYAVFVGNGPQIDSDEGVALEGFGGDNNDNKAVGGRLGFRPVPYVNVGVSGMTTKVAGNVGLGGPVPTQGTLYLVDVDGAFTPPNWDIRGEYIRMRLDSLTSALAADELAQFIPGTTWHAWYAQAAYRLAGITDHQIWRNFEPVFRYSELSVSGFADFAAAEEKRWTVGLDYWFAPSLVAKAAFEHRNFNHDPNEDVFRLQLAFGF